MAKILIFMLPEPGHLIPTFRVAMLLKDLGHTIEYLTVPDFRETITALGFGFRPFLSRLAGSGLGMGTVFEGGEAGTKIYALLGSLLASEGVSAEEMITRDLIAGSPDLVIFDTDATVLWCRKSATASLESVGCPVLRVSTTFTERSDSYAASLPAFIRNLPELVLCPQELDGPWATSAKHERRYVEASIFRRRIKSVFPWEWLDRTRKLVYCSFGTQCRAYPTALSALQQVIVTVGEMEEYQLVVTSDDERISVNLPRNVLVRKSVPQLQVLDRASVLITHGGLGGIKEAILARVPMIVIPFDHDQPLNAKRVEHRKLGVSLIDQKWLPKDLRHFIRYLPTDRTIHESGGHFHELFTRIENDSPSVSYCEGLLRTGAS